MPRYFNETPWFLIPFELIWKFISLIIQRTGRITGVLLAMLVISSGILLATLPKVAPVGIPVVIFGLLLFLKAIQ